MKLRQKLAAVLAATMVVTAVPVVTMAASSSRVTKTITVADDKEIGDKAPKTIITLKDGLSKGEFYVNLDGAEWTNKVTTVSIVGLEDSSEFIKVEEVGSKQIRVVVLKSIDANEEIEIDLAATKVTGDQAVVKIDGNDTEIDSFEKVYAIKNTAKANITTADVDSFYTGTELKLATIKLGEVLGSTLKEQKITVELDTTDFKFESEANLNKNVKLYGERGFKFNATPAAVKRIDDQTVEITIDHADMKDWGAGTVLIKGLQVESTTKAPTTGEIKAEVYGDKVNEAEVVVANVAQYGAEFTVKEVKETVAGKTETAKVTLKEVTLDSFMSSTVEVMVEGAYLTDLPTGWDAIEEDGKIVGMQQKFTADKKAGEKDAILNETEIKFYTELGTEGDVTLTASGRALGTDYEVVIGKVTTDFEVEATPMNVEVGVKGQKGGKIEITEADKAVFARGTEIAIQLPADSDVVFANEKPEINVTGEMKVSVSKVEKAAKDNVYGIKENTPFVIVTVDKVSKEAATITVENFQLSTDRTIADGSYDAKVFVKEGTKVRAGSVAVEDFITVGEVVKTTTTSIKSGATEMVVNGTKVTLDAPAYIEEKTGKMMVPLRAVAEAFGIPAKDIVYNAGEILVFANGRTVALTIGSTDAYLNGSKVTLASPAKLVNERTTVPVGDLARLLGLSVEWDGVNKTATFKN